MSASPSCQLLDRDLDVHDVGCSSAPNLVIQGVEDVVPMSSIVLLLAELKFKVGLIEFAS